MKAHGYYTTPSPRMSPGSTGFRIALYALLVLVITAGIGLALMMLRPATQPAVEPAQPAAVLTRDQVAWESYRVGEHAATLPVAERDQVAWEAYRGGEFGATVPITERDLGVWEAYREGEFGATVPSEPYDPNAQ